MKSTKVFVSLVLATALLFSTAEAQMMGKGKGGKCDKMEKMGKGGGAGMMDMMHGDFMKKGLHLYFKNREALGLTDDQLEKLHSIKVNFKKSYIMDEAKLKVAKLELEELLDADSASMKGIEKKVNDIAALKEKLLLAKVKTRVEAKKVLTEEQRKKAKDLMHKKREASSMMKGGSEDMSMEGMKMEKEAAGREGHH